MNPSPCRQRPLPFVQTRMEGISFCVQKIIFGPGRVIIRNDPAGTRYTCPCMACETAVTVNHYGFTSIEEEVVLLYSSQRSNNLKSFIASIGRR